MNIRTAEGVQRLPIEKKIKYRDMQICFVKLEEGLYGAFEYSTGIMITSAATEGIKQLKKIVKNNIDLYARNFKEIIKKLEPINAEVSIEKNDN